MFIRAPWIESAGAGVEVCATCEGHGVAAGRAACWSRRSTPSSPMIRAYTRCSSHRSPVAESAARRAGRRRGAAPLTEEVVSSCPGTPNGRPSSTRRARRRQARQAVLQAARAIMVAAKEGGPDPDNNTSLPTRSRRPGYSMPKDNIERAIQRGARRRRRRLLRAIIYEGYGPNGVAMIVDALTDNHNRTAAEIRNIFTKHSGSLAQPGAVAWMFERKRLDRRRWQQARRRRRHGRGHRRRRRRRGPGRRPVRDPHRAGRFHGRA